MPSLLITSFSFNNKTLASIWYSAKSAGWYRPPQWRNRLAHGTYRQYALRYAGVVSSSLTWGIILFYILKGIKFYLCKKSYKKALIG